MASAKRLQQEAYRAWFVGLIFNTVAGAYTLWQLRQKEQNIDKKEAEGVVESKKMLKYGPFATYLVTDADRPLQGTERHESPASL
jgi:hypothetical protein